MAIQLPDAANYGGFANTPLARIEVYDKIIMAVYEKDFLFEITNSDITERIRSCTQEVQILKDPDVGEWRTHTVGQEMIHNSVTFTATKLKICYAAYLAFQFDDLTIAYACDWDLVEDRLLTKGYESYVALMRRFVFSELILYVHDKNRGEHAGRFATHDLGTTASPIKITPDNVPAVLSAMQDVLSEWHYWIDDRMLLIVPMAFKMLIQLSKLSSTTYYSSSSGDSILIDGKWPRQLLGFNVYETVYLPHWLSSNQLCWYLIAGNQEAYAYASDIIQARVVRGIDTFTTKYQMVAAWGGVMLYPKKIVVACCYFDNMVPLH